MNETTSTLPLAVAGGVTRGLAAGAGTATAVTAQNEMLQFLGALVTALSIGWSVYEKFAAARRAGNGGNGDGGNGDGGGGAAVLLLAVLGLGLAASGCVKTNTHIKGNIGGAPFTWDSPKDVAVSNLVVTAETNGTLSLKVGSIGSTMSATNIQAQGQARSGIIGGATGFLDSLGGFLGSLLGAAK